MKSKNDGWEKSIPETSKEQWSISGVLTSIVITKSAISDNWVIMVIINDKVVCIQSAAAKISDKVKLESIFLAQEITTQAAFDVNEFFS